MNLLEKIGQRALFRLDPETAHGLSIAALKSRLPVCGQAPASDRLKVKLCGLAFPNPLGMAAGYDKNGEVPDALLRLGFGFSEVGTVTPLAQAGNAKPRIFRLRGDEAVINRLGFNNEGHERLFQRMKAREGYPGIVGINIGANKDSTDRFADYELGVRRFAALAGYLTVNISSPNTPGLRSMQVRESLAELLTRVMAARGALSGRAKTVPVFLKVAPDLNDAELADIAAEVADKRIEGVIVSNTTLSRSGLTDRVHHGETGGLSGKPLFVRSTAVLARMRKLLGDKTVLVGVGGVDTAETALEKIRAGADLVQLYTGMIYAGPSLPGKIVAGMLSYAEAEGLKHVRDIRDSRVEHWAGQPI
ncbi:quinone-dependent dihydroorotate dehydrogenase [Mesorhizobium sp. NBSH29]|uniref:quinone-dependent dihydroorotate dehydrogenase n=1 Tax=Mesorhizobium sp. NBSH29 TaxID=2654249 RepID=UPI0018964B57|nr:quinone-dependent dihydroorotate dehydrogenase [Mesorhizobium sp. NBSH29]QPC86752.1 quinone-dependent dihydroorotate dehydrogenase [Mesorhizobium sp. NBSH29]